MNDLNIKFISVDYQYEFAHPQGRFYNSDEENVLAQVIFLGSKISEYLFGNDTAVGKIVFVKGKQHRAE